MKTTIDIADPLLERAKRHAKKIGKPLRSLVEEGLRHVLAASTARADYKLRDLSVGKAGDPNPLEAMSWQDLRDEIYAGR
ncbi:MAG: DUF2191 domain-containing protein [Kofleriaceae bacterium]